jgi:hypothetical protein
MMRLRGERITYDAVMPGVEGVKQPEENSGFLQLEICGMYLR